MRATAQDNQDALVVVLTDIRARVLRAGQPAYQSVNELGCVAELVHEALARTLDIKPPRSLRAWEDKLPEHGYHYPATCTALHHTYGWRNKCSHDDPDKEIFDRGWAESNLELVARAIEHLDRALSGTRFRHHLLTQQRYNRPHRLAATLHAALLSCAWTGSLDSAIKDHAANAGLDARFVDSLRRAETLRGRLLGELLSRLAKKDHNDTANPLRELAAAVAPALSRADYDEHLAHWFARNDLEQPPARAQRNLPTLRFTLDSPDGEAGPFVLTLVELLHPPHEPLTRILHQVEERPLDTLRDLVHHVKEVGIHLAQAGGGELDDYVIQLCVPVERATTPFHAAEEALSGLALGELCRCLTVQLLLPTELARSYDRRSLTTLVAHPQSRPTNSAAVTIPVPAKTISKMWKKQKFACLFALDTAAIRNEDAQQIVHAFQRYPVCIADRGGKQVGDEIVEGLFDGSTECGLGDLFDRVTELRHPDTGAGLPLLVLWDDAAYQPHQPESPIR